MALRLEETIAKRAKANLATSTGGSNPQPCQKSDKVAPIDTKKEVAKIASVSHDTVAKVAQKPPGRTLTTQVTQYGVAAFGRVRSDQGCGWVGGCMASA